MSKANSSDVITWIEEEYQRNGYRPRLNAVWLHIAVSHKTMPSERRQRATDDVYREVITHYGIPESQTGALTID